MPKRSSEKDHQRLLNVTQAQEYLISDYIVDAIIARENGLLGEDDLLSMTGGLPGRRMSSEVEEETLIITPETDLRNEEVVRFIENWQREMIIKNNRLPQPRNIEGSRKLNWKPVWAWAKIHPQVTIKEISMMLKRPYTTVKRKVEEIDKALLIPFQK